MWRTNRAAQEQEIRWKRNGRRRPPRQRATGCVWGHNPKELSMTVTSLSKFAAPAALLVAGTAAFAQPGGTRSAQSLPPLPAAASHASDNSQGLPNANGQKPGRGEGEGHDKGRGRGHEIGLGHGHDSDSPG
jgi:hypothetical protein